MSKTVKVYKKYHEQPGLASDTLRRPRRYTKCAMCIGFLLFGPSTSASFQYPPLVGQRHGRSRWCLVSGPPPKVGTDCWRMNTTRCKCPFHHLLLLRPCDAFATTVREPGRTQANMAKDLESMASREPASLTNKKKLKVLELYFNSKTGVQIWNKVANVLLAHGSLVGTQEHKMRMYEIKSWPCNVKSWKMLKIEINNYAALCK